ncbi:MAG: cytochrome c biogenesis protein CcdA [Patescibacteria group bacterium]
MIQAPILPVVIVSGFIDSFNPCAISLLLIYISLMFTLEKSRKEIFTFGLFYVISIYVTYLFIGLGLLRAGTAFTFNPISKIVAIIVIIFGLINIKEYFWPGGKFTIRIPLKVRAVVSKYAYQATIASAVIVGILIGLYEFPCSGAIYLAIVGLLSSTGTFWRGLPYLFIYNFMFVLPLIIIFVLATNKITTEKFINIQEKHGRKLHLVLAIAMIILGISILKVVF